MIKSYHALMFIIVSLILMLVFFENGIEIDPVVVFFVTPLVVVVFIYILSNIKNMQVNVDNKSNTIDDMSEEQSKATTKISENNDVPEQKHIIKITKTTYSVFSRFILGGVITVCLVAGFGALSGEGKELSEVINFFVLLFVLPFIILFGGVSGVFLSSFILVVLKKIPIKQFAYEIAVLGILISIALYFLHTLGYEYF